MERTFAYQQQKLPTKPTIICDTREKKPWFTEESQDKAIAAFESATLAAGDYSIKEVPNLIVIERKKDGLELYGNFAVHRQRFYDEMARVNEKYQYAYIIIEQTYEDFVNPVNYLHLPFKKRTQAIAIVEASLLHLEAISHIHFHFAGKSAKRLAKRLLLKHYQWFRKEQKNAAEERNR